ncbi:sigma factor-like helix-turn-helix DNA-binding protein [Bradyrhizobium sp. Arg237L]|uniref:sigma factor-like helix-turn-helix DNA-binding protein n=1 Tax=Bradyrhizobium sp. Arg237L TaxID=3003352 RepID=UPI00249F1406|nr:sigma factor-like helix-turn-helix DNA-binding protein [Bradyrhizobium sp. Arg237L]MDI4238458.1 sigma factor-like helix-turn-helix DNA-binding protein [Bradyrhizobium sp. Arg237L]
MADGAVRDILERAVDELPDELRTVFVACVADGMTPGRCAELSALASETVEARLHSARSLLGEVLVRQIGPAFGGVYQVDDSRSERITNAVMDRLFPRRGSAAT